MMLCSNNVGMGTFDLHVLISCASEGFLSPFSENLDSHFVHGNVMPSWSDLMCF